MQLSGLKVEVEEGPWTAEPPDILTFISDKQYLGQMPLSKRQASAMVSIFGKDGREVFTNLALPIESVLLYGKGSGKDLLASYGIAYITYLVNLLKDAQEYFGLADGENIDIVNIATNSRQANNAFFAKLKSRIKSTCFMTFAPKINAGIIEFPNMLRLHSLHAENES